MLTFAAAGVAPSALGLVTVLLVAALYVGVVIYCINDLYKPERRVVGFSKDAWALIILVFSVFGIAAYYLYGRQG